MTVTTTTNRKDFIGDASTTAFAFTFNYFATSDVAVYLDDVKQTEVTHYTVAPASGTTGTVTFVTAPGSGVLITLIRELPLTQGIDLPVAGKFPADTVEEGLDRAMAAISDISERIDRSIVQDVSSTITNLIFPAPGATKLFRWNAAGTAIELVTLAVGDTLDVLTTLGDIIRGGAAGAAERLGIGATDQHLSVVAGVPAWATVAAQGLASVQVITATGTWTRPAGVKRVIVEVIGGGGGGGGADSNGTVDTALGGGAAGSLAKSLLDVSAIATSTVTIGAAGAGGTALGGNGGAGTNSVWSDGTNTLTGNGGGGAVGPGSAPTADRSGPGGSAVVATGGDLNKSGEAGGHGGIVEAAIETNGGNGGSSLYGGGGRGGSRNTGGGANAGGAASGRGAGGGGAVCNSTTSGAVGGVGTAGVIVVWEYK